MKEVVAPRNAKGQAHGYWECYHSNDKLYYKCVYINGKPNGFAEYYWTGILRHKKYHL